MNKLLLLAGLALLLAPGLLGGGQARAAGPFDGTWDVRQDCRGSADGAHGYTVNFPVEVKDSALSGAYNAGTPTAQTLSGTIGADGSAKLSMHGVTGDSSRTTGAVKAGTPFNFPVEAKFGPKSGDGDRTSGRACHFMFTRR